MSKNNIKNKLLETEDITRRVAEWIYDRQKKSTKGSNFLKTIDVSEQLEKLGIDNFAKEIMCKERESLSAFMTARTLIRECEYYYYKQEIWG